MILTDWLGVDYGVGSTIVYCEHFRRSASRMVVGKVVEITDKGTVIIEVLAYSRGGFSKERKACRIRENITVLES